MPEPTISTPRAEDYLPNWTAQRFVVLDPGGRWASAISRQTTELLKNLADFRGRMPEFENCKTARDVLLFCDQQSTKGLILFIDGIERDCVTILGRLARLHAKPPILVIGRDRHRELLPTLLEGGVDTTLFNITNDIPIAAWCVKVLPS